jgi:hypothetical protein
LHGIEKEFALLLINVKLLIPGKIPRKNNPLQNGMLSLDGVVIFKAEIEGFPVNGVLFSYIEAFPLPYFFELQGHSS